MSEDAVRRAADEIAARLDAYATRYRVVLTAPARAELAGIAHVARSLAVLAGGAVAGTNGTGGAG